MSCSSTHHADCLCVGPTYVVPRQGRPLQSWKILLRNHVGEIASVDLFVVPTIAFRPLFAFLVLGHRRRQLLGFAVTQNPTAEWLARHITEAFPWEGCRIGELRKDTRKSLLCRAKRLNHQHKAPYGTAKPQISRFFRRLLGLSGCVCLPSRASMTLQRVR
jgi:hypothetical protein